LDSDQRRSLGIFLSFQLKKHFNLVSTKAAELARMMTGRSDKSIRAWKSMCLETGEVPDSMQRKYQHNGVLWYNESLNKKSIKCLI